MKIERALKLQRGQTVSCPPDRGGPAFSGKVVSASNAVNKNHQGEDYIWVVISTPFNHDSVWPSNRIG